MKSPKKVRNDRRTQYIEDITRWREDMNFIFEWQNNILLTRCARSQNIVFAARK